MNKVLCQINELLCKIGVHDWIQYDQKELLNGTKENYYYCRRCSEKLHLNKESLIFMKWI